MSEFPVRNHGLESFFATAPQAVGEACGVSIQISKQPGQINLRGSAQNHEFTQAVSKVLEQDLPVNANTMTIANHSVFWLGPDEWLLLTPYENVAELRTQLLDALAGQHAAVTDVSGGNVVIRLAGHGARDVLAKGCTLDFHPDLFKLGQCAQSGLAKANVLIGLIDDQPVYEIVVRRSFSEYLLRWLQTAAAA